jgi:hypothetical protein
MAISGGEPQWSRLLSVLVLLLAGSVSIALVYSYTIQEPSTLKWNGWSFYEWLINFEGGFVRRGLAGHIIRQIAPASEIATVNLVVFVQFLLFVLVSIAFASVFVVGLRSTAFFVFCPLSFLGMALGNHYYYRKEVIFYIGIFLAALLMILLQRRDTRLARGAIFAVIGVWTAIGPFIHEGFIFFCVPIFALMLARLVGDRFRFVVVSSYIVLSVLLFGFLAAFAGNESMANQIWFSLSDRARSLFPSAGPIGGISAIGWSTRYAVTLTIVALLSGMATYYLMSLVIVYLVVGLIVSEQRRLSMAIVVTSPQFIFGFALVLISFLPLFVVAWDWGRVIGGVYVVSMAFFGLKLDDGVVAKVTPWLSMAARPALLTVVGLVFLLLTKVPECCIRAIDGNRDLWSVLANFARFVFH